MLSIPQQRQARFQRRNTMTNLQSCAGGFVWVAVAGILMLITFEPVTVEQNSGAPALQVAAEAATRNANAAV
jgi:hypothetical protein